MTGIWKCCLKSHKEIYQEFNNLQKILRKELKTNLELTGKQQDSIKIIIKNLGNEGFTSSVIICMARELQDPNFEFDTNDKQFYHIDKTITN
jgi:DNA-directed RNA polymerase specialized sigma54-like protein